MQKSRLEKVAHLGKPSRGSTLAMLILAKQKPSRVIPDEAEPSRANRDETEPSRVIADTKQKPSRADPGEQSGLVEIERKSQAGRKTGMSRTEKGSGAE